VDVDEWDRNGERDNHRHRANDPPSQRVPAWDSGPWNGYLTIAVLRDDAGALVFGSAPSNQDKMCKDLKPIVNTL
jgi:hypothetical protein